MVRRILAAVLVMLMVALPLTAYAGLEVGMQAPDFEAESTMGPVKLSDYLGKKHVLLAVYFKDFTGG